SIALSTSYYTHFSSTAPPTPKIYTLSLHDALPILFRRRHARAIHVHTDRRRHHQEQRARERHDLRARRSADRRRRPASEHRHREDRKSTRLNSSHLVISYAVFCLKKKKSST